MPVRVVVAEDSYLVREGVVRLLEAQDGIEVVGACEDHGARKTVIFPLVSPMPAIQPPSARTLKVARP